MNLYHGSRTTGLTEILPISATSVCGPTDPHRVGFRDSIFLTNRLDAARRYAGKSGVVYRVEAPDAQPYLDVYVEGAGHKSAAQRRKKLRRLEAREGSHTYVAPRAQVVGVVGA